MSEPESYRLWRSVRIIVRLHQPKVKSCSIRANVPTDGSIFPIYFNELYEKCDELGKDALDAWSAAPECATRAVRQGRAVTLRRVSKDAQRDSPTGSAIQYGTVSPRTAGSCHVCRAHCRHRRTAALAGLILRLYPARREHRPARNLRPCSDDTGHGAGDMVLFRARIGADADWCLRNVRDLASDRTGMSGTTGRVLDRTGSGCTLNGDDF